MTNDLFSPHAKQGLISRAVFLSWLTIIYNLLEGILSIWLGLNDDSIALAGFGVDSLIEVASAILVLWRFRGESGRGLQLSVERERRATLGIGALILFLALITAIASITQFWTGAHPATTWPGVIVSSVSLSFMFYLWQSKRALARSLDSATVMKDADCSLACIKLSLVLLAGSLVFLIIPSLWWADSGTALVLALLFGHEGWETVEAARKATFSGGCGCSHNR